jgi:hypothetical protein
MIDTAWSRCLMDVLDEMDCIDARYSWRFLVEGSRRFMIDKVHEMSEWRGNVL